MTWSKTEIRNARKLPLVSLLQHRGFTLHELPNQNFRLDTHPDLIVRDCYWIWKSRQIQGNTIDFFILIEGKSFSETMQILCPKPLSSQRQSDQLPQ